jgi:hypothetical protein
VQASQLYGQGIRNCMHPSSDIFRCQITPGMLVDLGGFNARQYLPRKLECGSKILEGDNFPHTTPERENTCSVSVGNICCHASHDAAWSDEEWQLPMATAGGERSPRFLTSSSLYRSPTEVSLPIPKTPFHSAVVPNESSFSRVADRCASECFS